MMITNNALEKKYRRRKETRCTE